MVYVKRKDTFHIDSTDLYGEYNSFNALNAHELCLYKIHTHTCSYILMKNRFVRFVLSYNDLRAMVERRNLQRSNRAPVFMECSFYFLH